MALSAAGGVGAVREDGVAGADAAGGVATVFIASSFSVNRGGGSAIFITGFYGVSERSGGGIALSLTLGLFGFGRWHTKLHRGT